MKQQGDGSVRFILGAIDPSCSCTLYVFLSKFAVITVQ